MRPTLLLAALTGCSDPAPTARPETTGWQTAYPDIVHHTPTLAFIPEGYGAEARFPTDVEADDGFVAAAGPDVFAVFRVADTDMEEVFTFERPDVVGADLVRAFGQQVDLRDGVAAVGLRAVVSGDPVHGAIVTRYDGSSWSAGVWLQAPPPEPGMYCETPAVDSDTVWVVCVTTWTRAIVYTWGWDGDSWESTGSFEEPAIVAVPNGLNPVGVADAKVDGDLGILWTHHGYPTDSSTHRDYVRSVRRAGGAWAVDETLQLLNQNPIPETGDWAPTNTETLRNQYAVDGRFLGLDMEDGAVGVKLLVDQRRIPWEGSSSYIHRYQDDGATLRYQGALAVGGAGYHIDLDDGRWLAWQDGGYHSPVLHEWIDGAWVQTHAFDTAPPWEWTADHATGFTLTGGAVFSANEAGHTFGNLSGSLVRFDLGVTSLVDRDGDGIPDAVDPDPDDDDVDDDGIVDGSDPDPRDPDADDDGLDDDVDPFPKDPDHDDDGILDGHDADPHDADADDDDLIDGDDPDPADPDTDEDGLEDGVDPDPTDPDTDDDGLIDGQDPNPTTPDEVDPVDDDADDDGLSDDLDADDADPDQDDDGLLDGADPDPTNPDTDGDGVSDGDEGDVGTDPENPDSDYDELPDGDELDAGTDPLDPDSDGDGLIDSLDEQPLVVDTGSCGCATSDGAPAGVGALGVLLAVARRRRR